MPVFPTGNNTYRVVHPAFTGAVWDQIVPGMMEDFAISYEFAEFMTRFVNQHNPSNEEYLNRMLRIANRKQAYGEHLINAFWQPTAAGEVVYSRTRVISRILAQYYLTTNQELPQTWDDQQQLRRVDEIIICSNISDKDILVLQVLYSVYKEVDKADDLGSGNFAQFRIRHPHLTELIEINGDTHYKLGDLRNRPKDRKDMEKLLKLGLVEYNMSKRTGRGRAPYGVKLTPMGKNFFEDFTRRFDKEYQNQTQRDKEFRSEGMREMQAYSNTIRHEQREGHISPVPTSPPPIALNSPDTNTTNQPKYTPIDISSATKPTPTVDYQRPEDPADLDFLLRPTPTQRYQDQEVQNLIYHDGKMIPLEEYEALFPHADPTKPVNSDTSPKPLIPTELDLSVFDKRPDPTDLAPKTGAMIEAERAEGYTSDYGVTWDNEHAYDQPRHLGPPPPTLPSPSDTPSPAPAATDPTQEPDTTSLALGPPQEPGETEES